MSKKPLFYIKTSFLISASALLLASCNHAEENKEKAASQTVVANRDSSIYDFIASFNEVERNLDSITRKQHMITITTKNTSVELKTDQKTRINNQIAAINHLMDVNRKKIADLDKRLKTSSHRNVELEKTIGTLNNQINQKDLELAIMNEVLNQFHAKIAQLQVTVGSLEGTVAEQNNELHTAYYIVGSSKDMQREKIIDREGGLLGIGKTSKITENVNNKSFTRIDYTKMIRIAVNSNDIKIVTSHPTDSYTLDKDNKKMVKDIMITNPEKFWSASKYLVIIKG